MIKHKEKIVKEYGFLIINGKYFQLKNKDGRAVFEEVSEKHHKKRMKLMKEISDKLINSLDREAVVMEALSYLEEDYLQLLHNSLYNSKRKVKPKTRKHNCVDMKVGNLIVPIVQ